MYAPWTGPGTRFSHEGLVRYLHAGPSLPMAPMMLRTSVQLANGDHLGRLSCYPGTYDAYSTVDSSRCCSLRCRATSPLTASRFFMWRNDRLSWSPLLVQLGLLPVCREHSMF